MNEFIKAWQLAFEFKGRSRRKDYWMFLLINFILNMVVSFIPLINVVYPLMALVPQIGLGIRRLHDIGKSGWWMASPFAGVPVVLFGMSLSSEAIILFGGAMVAAASIMLLVFSVMDSQAGTNQYGPNPKENSSSGDSDQGTIVA
ncbi:DUF805 domain-containing protein [Vibrio sp. SCSIO 43132]|uniref:DUF805 domain-containing protein n=1 Tax=Vibrio sp. SCSIO 43132 TaxID=2779363 RepID=UPI001CA856B6|nr:DUF805 domain-containing protein [Vibrio sp. SCSIO 43132]UAB71199.1 DUF805 domain-containing protein [Vibrio sp. SCSIO 43132]